MFYCITDSSCSIALLTPLQTLGPDLEAVDKHTALSALEQICECPSICVVLCKVPLLVDYVRNF